MLLCLGTKCSGEKPTVAGIGFTTNLGKQYVLVA